MAKTKETTILKFGKKGTHMYIPSTIRDDSQNPLKLGMKVIVEVDGKKMTITPVESQKGEG